MRLLIVGAGGLAREMFAWACDAARAGAPWTPGGFLSDYPTDLDGYVYEERIVGSIQGFTPGEGDVLLMGVGEPDDKRTLAVLLEGRGARFVTLVHPSAIVGRNVEIGMGSILCPGAVVTCDAKLGRFVTVNVHASVGHDSRVGDFCTLSGHADVTGRCVLEERVFMGSHACVIPRMRVGAGARIGAGSAVMRPVPAGVTVVGVPAKRLEF